jgi:DNA-binding Lrp family transcriptional regulator
VGRPPRHVFDSYDFEIVKLIMEEPKITLAKMREKIGLAESSIKDRRDFLEKNGYIRTLVEVDPAMSKWRTTNLLFVTMPAPKDNKSREKFLAHALSIPEVQSLDVVAGNPLDILLRIQTIDGERFEEIRQSIDDLIPGIFLSTVSVLKNYRRPALPAEALLGSAP